MADSRTRQQWAKYIKKALDHSAGDERVLKEISHPFFTASEPKEVAANPSRIASEHKRSYVKE